jgi:hypothetical protein
MMSELQKKKKFLVIALRDATWLRVKAENQDCYGMVDKIAEANNHEAFIAKWLGEIQCEIDKINKGE